MSTAGAGEVVGSRLSREARIGIAAVGTVVGIRIVGGNFVANDWEGWGTFVSFSVLVVLEGLILWALVFGLVVRMAAKSHQGRPRAVAASLGVLAVLSLAVPYSAPQAILGAGAMALGLAALDSAPSARRLDEAAVALGAFSIAVWLSFVAFTFVTGDWPDVTP